MAALSRSIANLGGVRLIYQELTRYSPIHDCAVTRLSTVDDRNHEFFCIIARDERAKKWRIARETALEQLYDAMRKGTEPGEVTVTLDLI